MNKRLGCLSFSGISSAIVTLVMIAIFGVVSGAAMFSPGELNANTGSIIGGVSTHAELQKQCTSCHTAPWEKLDMADKCLQCHTDIADQFSTETGLHGRLVIDPVSCFGCHTEHQGAHASATVLDMQAFPHQVTGFSLASHQTMTDGTDFTCESCHGNDITRFDAQNCETCHREIDNNFMTAHVEAFGQSCEGCHDGSGNVGKSFDHNAVSFHLNGKHAETPCADCHRGATSLAELQATPQDCFSCHEKDDAHDGQFGTQCAVCHNPTDWDNNSFDHNITGFALTGKHMDVECESCHVNNVYINTPNDCYSCHAKDDNHDGQFGTQCAVCHNTSGWDQAAFDHSLTGFQLLDGHANVDCESCHINNVYKGTPTDCAGCHLADDAHDGQFGTDCAACHNPTRWEDAFFDHNQTAFPLVGKHANADCMSCHTPGGTFKGTPQDCYSCHAKDDNHQGQFGTSCEFCHNPGDWKDVNFDHSTTGFTLTGSHTQVECESCHINNVYANTPSDCYSCHAAKDAHDGQFGTDCAACHNTNRWEDATFDHSQTAFPLVGKHTQTECLACHTNGTFKGTPQDCYSCHAKDDNHNGGFGTSCEFCHNPGDWKDVNFDHSTTGFNLVGTHNDIECKACHVNNVFKGTPQDCYSCHQKDDKHNGQFGTDCAQCHQPTKWGNVTFDHNNTGFPLTGSHVNQACTACHTNGQFKGTPKDCFSCHAKDDNHNGQFGTDCAACHNTGRWGDVTFDHNNTGFPLTGLHANQTCNSCHTNGQFKGTPKDCFSCHAKDDNHNGQFGTDCAACHNTSGWGNVTFDHNNTGFPLTGKHVNQTCNSCHTNGQFKGTPKDCYSCHAGKDKHNGQFGTDCAACHNTSGWGNVTFDHNNTGFPLTGKHTGVNCQSCHTNGQYKGTPKDCYSCHAGKDKHNGQFGTDCAKCHNTNGWGGATFDHNQTGFPLTGKHQGKSCDSCHKNGQFAGTPKDCYSCHAQNDAHNGQFSTDCAQCHKTSGWKPATFANHNFPLNHGGANSDCQACHPGNNYGSYTCFTCHDQNKMVREHAEEGINDISNCARCHPDGRED